MAISIKAYINYELLLWARNVIGMPIEVAAKKLQVQSSKLESWEKGETLPTIRQMRHAAKVYRQSFATFYLPKPPEGRIPAVKDYRRLSNTLIPISVSMVNLELRDAIDKRDIILELFKDLGKKVLPFRLEADLTEAPEKVGELIRKSLDVGFELQTKFKDTRLAFNFWREKLESMGLLVFQASEIDISELRGYSIFYPIMPIIGINRKDAHAARIFSLFHELTHLMLRQSSLCDFEEEGGRAANDRRTEVYCNHVAGAALVSKETLLKQDEINEMGDSKKIDDIPLKKLSKKFGVSREVILRRLLITNLISAKFYSEKQIELIREGVKFKPKKPGFVPPSTDIISTAGKTFVRTILEEYNNGRITSSDFSDYLGLKLTHYDKLVDAAYK